MKGSSTTARRSARDRRKALAAEQAASQAVVLRDDDALLMRSTVCAWAGVAKTSLYTRIAAGKFPRPIKIGSSSRWRAGDVRRYLAAQSAKVA